MIAVRAGGELKAREIYFLSSISNSDAKTLEKFISDAIERAVRDNYQSIAFPVIISKEFGCLMDRIAQISIEEIDRQLLTHSISVLFLVEPDQMDVYNQFRQRMFLLQSSEDVEAISTPINKGRIAIEQGDLTIQQVSFSLLIFPILILSIG